MFPDYTIPELVDIMLRAATIDGFIIPESIHAEIENVLRAQRTQENANHAMPEQDCACWRP